MSDAEDQTLSLNAQLTLSEPSAPRTRRSIRTLVWSQGITHVDVEFLRDQRGESTTIGGDVCRPRQRRKR
jgi:hypothetical protein